MNQGISSYSHHQVNITGWRNQCALATLAHWYVDQINSSGEEFLNTHADKELAWGFKEAYGLAYSPKLKNIKGLLSAYAHPQDKQIMIALALRKVLGKNLLKKMDFKVGLYKKFLVAARMVYFNQNIDKKDFKSTYGEIVEPNLSCFLKVKQASISCKKNAQSFKRITRELIKPYWDKIGFKRYCMYMGGQFTDEHEHFPMINAQELSILCESLKINLRIYNRKSSQSDETDYTKPMQTEQGYKGRTSAGTLHAAIGGSHWQRVLEGKHGVDVVVSERAHSQKMSSVFSLRSASEVINDVISSGWV